MESNKKRTLHEQMLNAYLSEGGDKQSIDEIRKQWDEILETDYAINVTLGLGLFDLMVIPSAAKAGAILRLSGKLDNFDHHLKQNKKFLQKVVANNDSTKTVHALLKKYPKDDVGELMHFISSLSVKRQNEMMAQLNMLFKSNQLSPDNLMDHFVESSRTQKVLSKNQQNRLEDIVEDYDLEDLVKIQNSKLKAVSHPAYQNVVKNLPIKEKIAVAQVVAILSVQGKSQNEILRSLSNVMSIPDSLPAED